MPITASKPEAKKPSQIARREADWQEFEANLKANRVNFPVPEV